MIIEDRYPRLIDRAQLLILDRIAADPHELAFQRPVARERKRLELHRHRLPRVHEPNVAVKYLRLYDKLGVARHHHEDRIGGLQHRAFAGHRNLLHCSVNRGANNLQPCSLGCFDQFLAGNAHLGIGLGEVSQRFADRLRTHFGKLLAHPGETCRGLALVLPQFMAEGDPAAPKLRVTAPAAALLVSAFVVSTCGLVYELLASTLASYLLGDSVTQFSTVIGTYLFAMGLGSWCSRYVKRGELKLFIRVELLIAVVGGGSAGALFLVFPFVEHFRVALYGLVLGIGFLVGLEIPLLIRILKGFDFRETVSNVLTFDYVGALVASLLFPLLLMPHLGMIRTGFLFGILNAAVALMVLVALPRTAGFRMEKVTAALVLLALGAGFAASDRLQRWGEVASYGEPVIYAATTKYQRIVLTRRNDDLRLYLNGNLQFSSRDEYRYHEALVQPVLGRVADPRNILILGGGDGLAAREVLKHPEVRHLTLVDLDDEMTNLFSGTAMLTALNRGSLTDPRMTLINADGFRWAREAGLTRAARYDAIIVDFPDPVDYSVGKLYTETFYRSVRRLLAPGGLIVVQSTSPLVAPRAFWTVASTLEAAGLQTRGYHVYVPSFGEWGFVLASAGPIPDRVRIMPGGRFLTPSGDGQLFDFPPDMARRPTPVNRLDNQILVREFADAWSRYES